MPRVRLADYSFWLMRFDRASFEFISDPQQMNFHNCVKDSLVKLLESENWQKFMEKFTTQLEKRGIDVNRKDLTYAGKHPINYHRLSDGVIWDQRALFIKILSEFLEELFVAELAKNVCAIRV